MKIRKTEPDGVLIIEPDVFTDKRGDFLEIYQSERYADAGIIAYFVQDWQAIIHQPVYDYVQ